MESSLSRVGRQQCRLREPTRVPRPAGGLSAADAVREAHPSSNVASGGGTFDPVTAIRAVTGSKVDARRAGDLSLKRDFSLGFAYPRWPVGGVVVSVPGRQEIGDSAAARRPVRTARAGTAPAFNCYSHLLLRRSGGSNTPS